MPWDSRPEGTLGRSQLSVVRLLGFGWWAIHSSMRFVFSFYWRKFSHKVLLQLIKSSNSWELHSICMPCNFLPSNVSSLPLVAPFQPIPPSSIPCHLVIPRNFPRATILKILLPTLGTTLWVRQDTSPFIHNVGENLWVSLELKSHLVRSTFQHKDCLYSVYIKYSSSDCLNTSTDREQPVQISDISIRNYFVVV